MHSFDTLQHYEDADMVQTVKQCNTINTYLPQNLYYQCWYLTFYFQVEMFLLVLCVLALAHPVYLFYLGWREERAFKQAEDIKMKGYTNQTYK